MDELTKCQACLRGCSCSCSCGCGCGLSECGDSGALVFRGGVVSKKRKSGVTLVWVAVAAKHKQTAKRPNNTTQCGSSTPPPPPDHSNTPPRSSRAPIFLLYLSLPPSSTNTALAAPSCENVTVDRRGRRSGQQRHPTAKDRERRAGAEIILL